MLKLVSHIRGGTEAEGVGECGAERDEVTGDWRKLRSEKLNDLYCTPNVIRLIKPRRIR